MVQTTSQDNLLNNFHEVIDKNLIKKGIRIYRGGQPDFTNEETMLRDLKHLKELGITKIIDYRNPTTTDPKIIQLEKDTAAKLKDAAGKLEMEYVNRPLSSRIAPTEKD